MCTFAENFRNMRIKELLESRGMTARELASATGLSEMGLSKIVRGKSSPSASTVEKIALALGVTCGALFDDYDGSMVHGDSGQCITCPKCGEVIRIKTEIVK